MEKQGAMDDEAISPRQRYSPNDAASQRLPWSPATSHFGLSSPTSAQIGVVVVAPVPTGAYPALLPVHLCAVRAYVCPYVPGKGGGLQSFLTRISKTFVLEPHPLRGL